MELSQRVQRLKPSATFAVNARVRELRAGGHDIIGFGVGEPDFDTPAVVREEAMAALERGATHYLPVAGLAEAREAIARKLVRENGIPATADDVVITCGAKHALFLGLQAVVDPGDEVVVPTPAWVSYFAMIELCGGEAVELPTEVDDDFKISPERLEAAITPRTRAVMINSPSNPCGTMYTEQELRALAAVVEKHPRVALISDEIYEKLVFTDIAHFSPGSIPAIADRVITINGLSKAYAMTGWRLGYAVGLGGAAKAIAKLQGQMTSHATTFAQAAVAAALDRAGAEVERMRRTFAARSVRMYDQIAAIPGLRCPRPTGAFYVFPDVSALYGRTTPAGRLIDSSESFAEGLLEEAHVAVVPGADFGAGASNHIRMGFACSDAIIDKGCQRLAAWCAALEGVTV